MAREVTMEFSQGNAASGGGLLRAIEVRTPDCFPASIDTAFPFAVVRTEADASKSIGIVRLLFAVAGILCVRASAQISNAIVGRISADVVDFLRPFAIDNKPNQSMGRVKAALDTNLDVSERANIAGGLASVFCVPSRKPIRIGLPAKNAKRGVIVEDGSYSLSRQVSLARLHLLSLLFVWQRWIDHRGSIIINQPIGD